MSWNDELEYVFYTSYPSGRTPINMIDDFTRIIKEGYRNRLVQEHFWSRPDDAGYVSGEGGKHRPNSARIFAVRVGPDKLPGLLVPLRDYENNVLYGVYTDANKQDSEDVPDDDQEQWKGTVWVRDEQELRPLMTRYRGKFRFNGLVHFSAKNQKWYGMNIKGLTLDDTHTIRGTVPDLYSDGIVLRPFHRHSEAPRGSTVRQTSLVYPIRVGKFAASDDRFTAPDQQEVTEGLAVIVGNYRDNSSGGVMYNFTRRGLEIYTSGPNAGASILVDGVDIRKHDHSGGVMGASVKADNMGGLMFFARQHVVRNDVTLPANSTDWHQATFFGALNIASPGSGGPIPGPEVPLLEAQQSSASSFDSERIVTRCTAYVRLTAASGNDAQMIYLGIGQDLGAASGGVTVVGATTVPMIPSNMSPQPMTLDAVYSPEFQYDPQIGINLFLAKVVGANTVKFTTIEATLVVMSWLRSAS